MSRRRHHQKPWQAEDVALLRAAWDRAPIDALSRLLGRTPSALVAKAVKLGISPKAAPARRICSQCGQPFSAWACGPTHAVVAAGG